jgi:hypothetical protein
MMRYEASPDDLIDADDEQLTHFDYQLVGDRNHDY